MAWWGVLTAGFHSVIPTSASSLVKHKLTCWHTVTMTTGVLSEHAEQNAYVTVKQRSHSRL